jgi:hypothetical protein
MTEDGIKIALTAEELELLKALAWTAGDASPAMFARNQLLSALGSGQLGPQGREKARRLGLELRRLHEELKGFLADSLPASEGIELPLAVEESNEGNRAWAGDQSEPAETTFSAPTRFSFGRMAPPRPANVFPGYHRSSAHAPTDSDDDLEEMAGKAFAISPRLGSFVPPTPTREDNFAPVEAEQSEELERIQTFPGEDSPAPVVQEAEEEVPAEPVNPMPTNSFEIPKIDVPGLEPESPLRFEGDPLVDLLDQELLKMVEAKVPPESLTPAWDPGPEAENNGTVSFAPSQDASIGSQNLSAYSNQQGGSLADKLLESVAETPVLDHPEAHRSLTEELVDWVQDLPLPSPESLKAELPTDFDGPKSATENALENPPAAIDAAFETKSPAANPLFLSAAIDPNQSEVDQDHGNGIAATDRDTALATDSEDNGAQISDPDSEAENGDQEEESTVLPRPPKIKPVEISGNSPPRKRRS